MSDLQNISRNTYEMQIAPAVYNRGEIAREKMVSRPNADDGTRASIDAFLRVLDQADSLECIADITMARDPMGIDTSPIGPVDVETPRYVMSVLLTHINTMKKAKLEVSYTADGQYSVNVVLGPARQLSSKSGARKAAALIKDYLSGRKKTRQLPIVRRDAVLAGEPDHKYADLELEFEE